MEFYSNTPCDYFNIAEMLGLPVPSSQAHQLVIRLKEKFYNELLLLSTDVDDNKQFLLLVDKQRAEIIIYLQYFQENLPVVVLVLAVDTAVLLEVTEGTRGNDEPKAGTELGPNGIDGIEGPSGTGLLTAVLVKVVVPETLVKVGVARFSNRDVRGSCIK